MPPATTVAGEHEVARGAPFRLPDRLDAVLTGEVLVDLIPQITVAIDPVPLDPVLLVSSWCRLHRPIVAGRGTKVPGVGG